MYGSLPPLYTRSTVGARRPANDPYTAISSSDRPAGRSRASRGSYRSTQDWATSDSTADYREFNRSSHTHFVRTPGSVYDSADLAGDYVDVWAERNESYGDHASLMNEWESAIRRRGLQTASSSSSTTVPHDPLSDALFAAMGNGQNVSPPTQETPLQPTDDTMETAIESDMGDDEQEECSDDSTTSMSSTSSSHTRGSSTSPNKTQFPAGGKNAKRRRERMTARMHERADRMQQQCDETERELTSRVNNPHAPITTTTNTSPKPLKDFTSDNFFDALDAAVKHAQANSTAASSERSGNIQQLVNTRPSEPTPDVPTTAYMRQICGDLMTDIDPLVAYRMIFTVDYILFVHQTWSARMHVPVEARPRMKLKVAAALLRNDSLYIDRCAVLEVDANSGETATGEARTMVQFGCKFNNMLAEDQEEADRKRKPFRPFNEAELRADVDEYCVATSLWACDMPGRVDDCSCAMLSDSASAYEKSPMGDVLVYWHSFAFSFRAHGATRV